MPLVSGGQVRAARALLKLDQAELAVRAGISPQALGRIESIDERLAARHDTALRLQRAIEVAGIVLTDDEGEPGVRLRRRAPA
jgi:transcriptional regulator with XRE-family HTH domain